jgi:hypothetical protein
MIFKATRRRKLPPESSPWPYGGTLFRKKLSSMSVKVYKNRANLSLTCIINVFHKREPHRVSALIKTVQNPSLAPRP